MLWGHSLGVRELSPLDQRAQSLCCCWKNPSTWEILIYFPALLLGIVIGNCELEYYPLRLGKFGGCTSL